MSRSREARRELEDATRQKLIAYDDALFPGIRDNPYMVERPFVSQRAFLGAHVRHDPGKLFEGLFGGQAGPGKSTTLLQAAAQYVDHPDFAALILRRTFADLSKPGAIMDRAKSWWIPLGVRWHDQTHTFTFPSGAKVAFGYLQNGNDHLQYQGSELQLSCWDELTQFPLESQYLYVGHSRVRRKAGNTVPLRTLSASNPGGPGHVWVRERFVGDPQNGIVAPQFFLPARMRDNPYLDQEAYIESLMHLHPTVREQLLNGDWTARDPGDYFRAEWFGPLLDPEADKWPAHSSVRIRWWDLAASEKSDAARTAGVLMARHTSGVRAVEHVRAFRATPGKRDDLIVQTARADGYGVTVGLEIEGGSGGPAQFEALAKRLKAEGLRVVGARPRIGRPDLTDLEKANMLRNPTGLTGKQGRADPVASCLERGHQRRGECEDTGGQWWGADRHKDLSQERDGVRLFAGSWTQAFLDELEAFPDGATVDMVDATSGAWAWLEAHPAGLSRPQMLDRKKLPGEIANVHPDDRPEPDAGKDRSGRYTP